MPFTFERTSISDVILVTPRVFPDGRGSFMESYKRSDFAAAGIGDDFVQDNHSISSRGVVRGLHYQLPPHAQGKLVRVIRGAVWDVAVDVRRASPSFGLWVGYELSEENRCMLWIPPGFAHGFLVLRDDTHFVYKCTAEYAKTAESGIRWDDPEIAIEWPPLEETATPPSISEKDLVLPFLRDAAVFEEGDS